MIDLRRLRNSPNDVRSNLARRNIDLSDLDRAAEIDIELREMNTRRDEVRAGVKDLSKRVGEARRTGEDAVAESLSEESRNLGEEEKTLDERIEKRDRQLKDLLLTIPNEISSDVPGGTSEDDNPIVKEAPETTWADHQRVPHWEIGKQLGLLGPERAVAMSGSMFNMFRGPGATFARALCQFALDQNADAWEEVRPPTIVRTDTMIGTGHLPKFEDEAYAVERDEMWLIPTAEVPLTSMARNSVIEESQLPWRMMAYSPCYRREAGSAGKDTRGLLRVHEFDKVELMAYTSPEQGEAVMLDIRDRAERTFEALGLTIRVIEICAGDLGRSHHRSFDIEAYAPGCDQWLEVSSCSWYGDYQARRAGVRYKPTAGGGNQVAHTCNGTALAVPRAFAALVETHRQSDGTVRVPDVLQPYMRGLETIAPR